MSTERPKFRWSTKHEGFGCQPETARREGRIGPSYAQHEGKTGIFFTGERFTCANPKCSRVLIAAWFPAKCPSCRQVTR